MACTLLLSSHNTIKPMDSHLYHQLKNGVIIVSAAVCLSYGAFKTVNYLFYPKSTGGNDKSTETPISSHPEVIAETKTIKLDLSTQQINDIYARGEGHIIFSQIDDDRKESISATGLKTVIDNLEMSVDEKGSLRIGPKENYVIANDDRPTYCLNLKKIKNMYLYDMIKATLTTKITAQSLILNLANQATITTYGGSINVDSLVATGSGRTLFVLEGRASKQGIYLSDYASYNATDARSHYAHIEATGTSKIRINIEDQDKIPGDIRGFIAGASELAYKGKPDISFLQRKDDATIMQMTQITIY